MNRRFVSHPRLFLVSVLSFIRNRNAKVPEKDPEYTANSFFPLHTEADRVNI